MRQIQFIADDKPKKAKWMLILLGLVIIGGVVSFFVNGGAADDKKADEEFQFIEFAPPPPPPPPPPAPDEPEPEPEPDEMLEPIEIPEDTEVSTDEPTNNVGIDLGEMAAGLGAGPGDFVITSGVGRRGRRGAGDEDEDELGSSDAVESASPTMKTQPIYPSSLLKNKIGGKVIVAAVVNSAGVVTKVTVKTSSGQPELDKAAMAAVQKWKFKPGSKGGKAVQSTCLIPYTFEVKNS